MWSPRAGISTGNSPEGATIRQVMRLAPSLSTSTAR